MFYHFINSINETRKSLYSSENIFHETEFSSITTDSANSLSHTGLLFSESTRNNEGIGFEPDLWVNPLDAEWYVIQLLKQYKLKESIGLRPMFQTIQGDNLIE